MCEYDKVNIVVKISPSLSRSLAPPPGGGGHRQRQQSGRHRPVSHRAAADQRDGGGGESGAEPPENPGGGARRRGTKRGGASKRNLQKVLVDQSADLLDGHSFVPVRLERTCLCTLTAKVPCRAALIQ